MIVVRTTIPIDPARRYDAMAHVEDLVAHSRTEAGTVRYGAAAPLDDPNTIRFFEQH